MGEIPKELRGKILTSIKNEELKRARVLVLVSIVTVLFSIGGGILALKYMIQGFSQSSFYSYLSILFSDPDIAFVYWRELSLSLVETLPFVGITLSLVAIAALLMSVRMLLRNAKPNLIPSFNN